MSIGMENDEQILKWILEQRDLHVPVSRESVQEYARKLCGSEAEFKASTGWLDKFMKRHNLSLRCKTSLSQKLPADLEDKVQSFTQFVKNSRIENEFDDEFIINMDETPAYFDLVPNKTVEQQGKKSVIVRTSGSEKRHVTVVLAVAASGAVLPTMIIFKGKRALKGILAPNDVIVTVQEKAWVDEAIMIRWVDECLRQYTNRNRTLLVMDSFRCHIMDSVKKRVRQANAETAVIPGGCTSILQPLDVSINKPFKGWLRASWQEHIRAETTRVDLARKAGDMAAKVKPASKQQLVDWIVAAVGKLREKPELIQKSFVVTGITPALNGADDHLVRKDDQCEQLSGSDDDDDYDFLGFTDEDINNGPSLLSDLSGIGR